MTKKQKLSLIQHALGGDWSYCRKGPVAGVKAVFPRFHSVAVVGVVNACAERLGLASQAVALAVESRNRRSDDPLHLQQVILPVTLVEDERFNTLLAADLRPEITSVIAHHLNRPSFFHR